jgi:hypothetical protein
MLPIELRILRNLSALVAGLLGFYACYLYATWDKAPTYGPVATSFVALFGAVVALLTILAQRDIARRRAAIDFFLKTEMDQTTIELYKTFKRRAYSFDEWAQRIDFTRDRDYNDIRSFLNICELIAVGVLQKAFSGRVSYAYWGDVLPYAYNTALPLIERIRTTPGEGTRHTYSDLQELCGRWSRGFI